jgi:hypothetical protein
MVHKLKMYKRTMADCIALVFDRSDLSDEEKMTQNFIHAAKEYFRDVSGKVYALPSLRQDRDLDLVVWMHFDKYRPSIETGFISNQGQENEKEFFFRTKRDVWFNSALLLIELKKHSTQDSISIRNSKLYVKYGDEFKNASDQNFEQVFHLQKYLADRLGIKTNKVPRIQNLIWLYRCIEMPADYDELDNVIYGIINFTELLKQLCRLHKPVSFDQGANITFSSTAHNLIPSMDAFFEFMGKEKANGLGIISRSKLDKIVSQRMDVENSQKVREVGQKFLMVKGKPGTGKTLYLMQIAFHLCKEEFKPIVLTYNKALVQDIRRMLKYSDNEKALKISTIHSFMLKVLESIGVSGIAENGFRGYEDALAELSNLIKGNAAQEIRDTLNIAYDIALIDEAQDCLEIERDLILRIFEQNNVVVSVGSRQIVRKVEIKWIGGPITRKDSNVINLDISHRNKKDLVDFFNAFSKSHFEPHPWELKENQSLTGGKLHIIPTDSYNKAFHLKLTNELIERGNSMYDLMFLVPNATDGASYADSLCFTLSEWGVKAFNNTAKDNIEAFPVDEHRVLNYHSCRGLESWVLVCWKLDLIIRNIKSGFIAHQEGMGDLNLHVSNWLLIIFTRAIDTLVITFDDESSEEAKLITGLAQTQSFAHMSEIKKRG